MQTSDKPQTTETHIRSHRAVLSHKEVERILAEAVAKRVDRCALGRQGTSYKVRFEDATEGSPPYRIGTKAIVEIVEDLLPAAVVAEDSSHAP